jgi:hypothetical protein
MPRAPAMEIEMHRLILNSGIAGACVALGFIAFTGPAKALAPLALDAAPSLVVPVMDEEDLAVEEDLRPDEVPLGAGEGETTHDWMMPPEEGEDSGDIEDEMIDKIGPGAE